MRTYHYLDILYEYEVGGKKYSASNIYPSGRNPSFRYEKEAEEALLNYPLNSIIPVFYEPNNPSKVGLVSGKDDQMQFSLTIAGVGLIFLVVGGILLGMGIITM